MIKPLSILYIMLLVNISIQAQEANVRSVEELFLKQISLYPQEKIYVQTDRSTYLSGETIWFRVHLVDALLLKQANASRYVYIELINPQNAISHRVKLRPDSIGCFHGNIRTEESLKEGTYSLRAYTRFMQNQGEDYFFTKPIYLINPQKPLTKVSLEEKDPADVSPVAVKTFEVSFFPEGGHAPLATEVKMAFKAINSNGLSEDITGEVYDELDQLCTTFQSEHLGMGHFRMYYTAGKKYYAICTNKKNVSKRFDLPVAADNVVSIKAVQSKQLRISLSKSPNHQLSQMQLIAHIRGVVLYEKPWDDKRGYVTFEQDFFPAGIVHFLLIDQNRNILSERLVFSTQEGTLATTKISFDKETYKSRERIEMKVQVTDADQAPVTGNISLVVVDRKDVKTDTTSTIISTLLLSSELKGHIESPMSYLQKDTKKSVYALDVLMLTQGWRRYNIPEILKGNLTNKLPYSVETGEEVTGKADGVFSSLKEGRISLLAMKDSVIGTSFTEPEKNGRFTFSGLEYPEDTKYIIQALTKKNSTKAFIEIDSGKPLSQVKQSPICMNWKPEINDEYISKMNRKYTIENGIRVIDLNEIEIVAAKKPARRSESAYYSAGASQVVTAEDVETWNVLTIFDLLRRIPGVTVRNDEVFFRGQSPMLLLDNVPQENSYYDMLDVNDISEAFVSPSSSTGAIFGPRGANGAIVINTKKGFVQKNKLNSNIQIVPAIGYQQTVEFYSPTYATEEEKHNKIPDMRSTIYWNPNVVLNEQGVATLTFYSADTSTEYGVVIEGVSNAGHVIYSSDDMIRIK